MRKRPATVNYADKTSGVTFEYPRRYAIETGDAASLLVASNPIPMNFVQPGGVALAAVELPETNYVNTDFSSAYFNVSINKTLSADQCNEFSVPQMKSTAKSETPSTEVALTCHPEDGAVCGTKDPMPATASTGPEGNSSPDAKAKSSDLATKLMIGDMELRATEAVSGEGTRQSDSKYFHIYQNGACYEFALNVTTNASEEGLVKHVDRDRVFTRLEQILSTVKINPVATPKWPPRARHRSRKNRPRSNPAVTLRRLPHPCRALCDRVGFLTLGQLRRLSGLASLTVHRRLGDLCQLRVCSLLFIQSLFQQLRRVAESQLPCKCDQ